MKFNFSDGDLVAVLIDKSIAQALRNERLPRQSYEPLEWLEVESFASPEDINCKIVNTDAKLIIWGDRIDLTSKDSVNAIVYRLIDNPDSCGLLSMPLSGEKDGRPNDGSADFNADSLLQKWLSDSGSCSNDSVIQVCFHKSSLLKAGYFSSKLPNWFRMHSLYRLCREFPIAWHTLSDEEDGNDLAEGDEAAIDEVLYGLMMLYCGENHAGRREKLLIISSRLFARLSRTEKLFFSLRHSAFLMKMLPFITGKTPASKSHR